MGDAQVEYKCLEKQKNAAKHIFVEFKKTTKKVLIPLCESTTL